MQEHWLSPSDLHKFGNIDQNFMFYGVSAISNKIENNILIVRPFGGTAILFKSSLMQHIKLIDSDTVDGRYTAIRYLDSYYDIIFYNVYFPFFRSSSDYVTECSSLIGNIEKLLCDYPHI